MTNSSLIGGCTDRLKWTPDLRPWIAKLRCDPACFCPSNQAASCCCFCVCCGVVGNAFALYIERRGISTVFAASILSMADDSEAYLEVTNAKADVLDDK